MPTHPPELDAKAVDEAICRMAKGLAEILVAPDSVVLVGILTHGVTIAQRLCDVLQQEHGWEAPLGVLDTTLYRDDFDRLDKRPMVRPTRIDFDVTDRRVVLVDDVISTGRTIRCALDALLDLGRPCSIKLAALVDRGHREFPIQPDVVGVKIDTAPGQKVVVRCNDEEEDDGVWIVDADA